MSLRAAGRPGQSNRNSRPRTAQPMTSSAPQSLSTRDTAVAGAPFDDNVGTINQGAAYVFTRSGTTWTEQQKLTAPDGGANDLFGTSVAIDVDTLVAGAPAGGTTDSGAAYVFTRSGTDWTPQAKLTASDGAAGDQFGLSVGIEGDTAVVGSPIARVGANLARGAAYVFTRDGTIWNEFQKLVASDGAVGDLFGFSVAIDGNTIVAGATRADGVRRIRARPMCSRAVRRSLSVRRHCPPEPSARPTARR